MALTKADKEFIEISLKPIVQRLDTFKEINKKQDERLEKLEDNSHENAKVFITMDEWIKTRALTCPNLPKIEAVQKVQENTRVTRKFIIKIGAFLTGFVAAVWGIVQIVNFFSS